jgi:hypothetical protein
VDGNLVFGTKAGHGKFTEAKKERVMRAIEQTLNKKREKMEE